MLYVFCFYCIFSYYFFFFFFFNDTATTEIYTLSLHDALPISAEEVAVNTAGVELEEAPEVALGIDPILDQLDQALAGDRKSTRLNSSHSQISYAVFCLKKKKKRKQYKVSINKEFTVQ